MLGYTIVLLVAFPLAKKDEFEPLSTALLIGAMSITYFAQYFFGSKYRLLLNADQRSFVQLTLQIITIIVNTGVSVLLIINGFSISIVKLSTSLIFLLRPLGMFLYVKKKYKINDRVKLTSEPIKQKWNGLAQHIAAIVLDGTDVIVLTIFSTMISVSIYNIYYMVTNGLRSVITSLTTGIQALLGNMYAKNETETLNKTFNAVEWMIHTIVVLLFSVAGVLIVPFVQVYTANITDANYIVPSFAVLLTLATAAHCLRTPYSLMVLAAGHYKQTQMSAIIEMSLNIVISIVLVYFFGLIGVAIGTLVAMTYRTVYYAFYLRKNILNRSIKRFFIHILVDVLTAGAIVAATFWLKMASVSYLSWIILALEVFGIAFVITAVVNLVFYKKDAKNAIKMFIKKNAV